MMKHVGGEKMVFGPACALTLKSSFNDLKE